MLARRQLPTQFQQWNDEQGAPFGKPIPLARKLKRWLPRRWYWALRGPFSVQRNNSTRAFEYPWTLDQLELTPTTKIVEIGGGLSGFQFALSKLGCDIINIDPGLEAAGKGWPCDQKTMSILNELYETDVQLINTTVDKANLPNEAFDYVLSVSVIEHLPQKDVEAVMREAFRCLKPGGRFVMTVDLFPDVAPFTDSKSNKYGGNINIREMLDMEDFQLISGDRQELYGFAEFDAEAIAKQLSESNDYLLGSGYPALVQCLVLQKPV